MIFITSKLLDGAKDTSEAWGKEDDIDIYLRLPGSFEIPLIAKKLASKA